MAVGARGTVLIETQTPRLRCMLARKGGVFTAARQLPDITIYNGFDGWLINVEQDAPEGNEYWSDLLVDFLLRFGNALKIDGYGEYQNVTTRNLQMGF